MIAISTIKSFLIPHHYIYFADDFQDNIPLASSFKAITGYRLSNSIQFTSQQLLYNNIFYLANQT